jgi:hypothetical protein
MLFVFYCIFSPPVRRKDAIKYKKRTTGLNCTYLLFIPDIWELMPVCDRWFIIEIVSQPVIVFNGKNLKREQQ